MLTNDITYKATKTARLFHKSRAPVRLLKGPVGCGKSVAAAIEEMLISSAQLKNIHGIRHTKWGVFRSTYPELKSTTIQTWLQWFPENVFGKIKWDSPITHNIKINDMHMEVLFMPVADFKDIKKLRSLELTGAYINELQYMPKLVFDRVRERLNRFPPPLEGAKITWTGLIADTNPTDTDHWIYKLFEENKPDDFDIFSYEPALIKLDKEPEAGINFKRSMEGTIYINNPEADYRFVVPDHDYWLKLVSGNTDDYIRVNLLGEYGFVKSGKPVHPEYNDLVHFTDKILKADPNLEIGLGWDFGLSPACAIVQLNSRGQFQVIDEVWTDDMNLRDFASNVVIPHLDRNYPFWRKNYVSRNDPAGTSASQTDGKSCEMILRELGLNSFQAANDNSPTPRRDSIKYFLGKMVDGQPAFILSSKCKRLRKGLGGGFHYAQIKASSGNELIFHDKPLKNMYSHICEALEYITMHYCVDLKKPPKSDKKPNKILHGNSMGF